MHVFTFVTSFFFASKTVSNIRMRKLPLSFLNRERQVAQNLTM